METSKLWGKCDRCGEGANLSYFSKILYVIDGVEHTELVCKPCSYKECDEIAERMNLLAERLPTEGD